MVKVFCKTLSMANFTKHTVWIGLVLMLDCTYWRFTTIETLTFACLGLHLVQWCSIFGAKSGALSKASILIHNAGLKAEFWAKQIGPHINLEKIWLKVQSFYWINSSFTMIFYLSKTHYQCHPRGILLSSFLIQWTFPHAVLIPPQKNQVWW